MLVGAALVVLVSLALWARQAADFTPTSDIAVIESYTLLASQGDLLLGPYSRFQWHHPGPLYFFAMAPFYALSDWRTAGLNAGALALNLLAFSAIAWVLIRRASALVALAASAGVALYSWRAGEALASPWNPHVPIMPMVALVVAAAGAMSGTPGSLPLVAVLASLIAQTHVALLPPAVSIGCGALAVAVIRGWGARRPGIREMRWTMHVTFAALVVCWAPPILEQLTSRPGNLRLLWSFFMTETHPGPAWSSAVSAWGDMVSGVMRPDFYVARGWPFRESPVRWAEALGVAQLAALVGWMIVSRRSKQTFEFALTVVLALTSLLGLWSATRIEGEIFDHGVFWMSGIGAINTAMLVALGPRLAAARRALQPAQPLAIAGVCLLGVLVPALAGVRELRDVIRQTSSPAAESQAAALVASDLIPYLKEHAIARPLVKLDQDAWGMAAGVILRLQKSRVPVAIEDDWLVMFTPRFAATGREPDILTIAGKPQHIRMLDAPGDAVAVAHDPLFVHHSRSTATP
jgi:hypothetical protein